MKSHPKVYPNIYSGPASMLLRKIESGEIELGFFFHIPDLSEKLQFETQIPTPFRLVVSRNHKKDADVLSTFIGSREIDDTSTRRFPTLEKLKAKYPKAAIKISSNNLSAHKEFVLQGAGVAVLPEFSIQRELKEKVLVDVLPNEEFIFQMKVVKRKNAVLSLSASKLMEHL